MSQSNLGGNTDSNHLIPGEEWAFFIRLAQPSSRTACNTHFFLLFPGIECRLFFVLCPSLYLGTCFYSAGCYPAFSYVYSPALNAGLYYLITNYQSPITNNHIMVICWLYAGHVLVICYTLLITSRGPIQARIVPLWLVCRV